MAWIPLHASRPMHVCEADVWQAQKVSGLPATAGGPLLRCFVRREMGGDRAVAKFQLFLGSEHNEPDASKFLMAALLTSRCTCVLSPQLLYPQRTEHCSTHPAVACLLDMT